MRNEGCKDTMKLIVAFHNLARTPKNYNIMSWGRGCEDSIVLRGDVVCFGRKVPTFGRTYYLILRVENGGAGMYAVSHAGRW